MQFSTFSDLVTIVKMIITSITGDDRSAQNLLFDWLALLLFLCWDLVKTSFVQYWKIVENSGISHIKWQLKTLSGLYALTPHMHIATGVHIAGEIPKTVDNDIEFSAICKNNHKSKYCNLTDPRDAFCIFRFLSGITSLSDLTETLNPLQCLRQCDNSFDTLN